MSETVAGWTGSRARSPRTRKNAVFSRATNRATGEGPLVATILTAIAAVFLLLFLALPLAVVFIEAFGHGFAAYLSALRTPDAVAAIKLTLLVAAIAVPMNIVFGLAAAWAIAKFRFTGKSLLVTLIDLPFSVSPVSSTCLCSERKVSSGLGSRRIMSR